MDNFPMQQLWTDIARELAELETAGLRRDILPIEAIDGPLVRIRGRSLVCWCSNDYLGLSAHPRLRAVAAEVVSTWGVGSRASRLLSGTSLWHQRLEEALAAWFAAQAAVVYPSGYLANLGTITALLSNQDVVVVDRLAHASLVEAARASRAKFRVFHHNDASHAAELLSRSSSARRRMIVTEGVFSMEGDCAPLRDLLEVAEAHQALVYVDDAHGAFVLGDTGRGSPEAAGLPHHRFLYMGTLGKALGCQGGFVTGPVPLIRFLHHRARSFIYTTALPTSVVAAAVEALEILGREMHHRLCLWERVRSLTHHLHVRRLLPESFGSHIIPVEVGRSDKAIRLSARLWQAGIWAPAIRPPTVPKGKARLRITASALHEDSDIERLAEALKKI